MTTILMLGSGPSVLSCRDWPRAPFDRIVAINNAHQVRPDWDDMVYPWDFPVARIPRPGPGQRLVGEDLFVPAQNAFGGFVYGGGTMAFTASYWVLDAHRPRVLAVLGCDMHYPKGQQTHFYGTGTADPLRPDITLRSLEAKSARLMVLGARQGTALVNLSTGPSRLVFPRADRHTLRGLRPAPYDRVAADEAMAAEAALGYMVPSGRYWEEADRFDPAALDAIDALWLAAARPAAAARRIA